MAEDESLSAAFDKFLDLYRDIETSSLPTNSPELQSQIKEAVTGLVRATVLVSEMGVFSSNETLEDLPTSSVKFLLLPALLGSLTLKRMDLERPQALRLAVVYLRDFLHRCWNYGIPSMRPPEHLGDSEEDSEDSEKEDSEEEEGKERRRRRPPQDTKKSVPPTPEELRNMARHREEKIKRYREKQEVMARLEGLKGAAAGPQADEEAARQYIVALVKKFVYESVEELESVVLERKMLRKMMSLKLKGGPPSPSPPAPSAPLKPILITRDACQRNVFGLGYPSHPTLTVAEFYDQRVKEGWFPDPAKSQSCLQDRATLTQEEEVAIREKEEEEEERKEEEDDPASLERARERDEWRDTHRRGWGNTYNRS